MITKLRETIQKHNLLEKGDHVIVGVSGGPDSICLLYVLFDLKDEYQLDLSVVHINHMLRGKDADEDETYVKELCSKEGIPFYSYKINVREMGKRMSTGEEEAGRKARYDAFLEILKKTNADKIAIAQNMNDQAETLLMRLVRGSGLDGLAGIDYKRDGIIIRPLLDISREEIEQYCKDNNLKPRTDKTNLKAIYTRNKIRLELIPYLEDNFNSRIISNLWKTAKILKEDKDFIYSFVNEAYKKCCIQKIDKEVHIQKEKYEKLHPAVKKRVILKAIGDLGVHQDIGTIHLESVLHIIDENKTSAGLDLPYDIRVEVGYENIVITRNKAEKSFQGFCYKLEWGNNIQIKELSASLYWEIAANSGQEISKNDYIKFFDYDKFKAPLVVRTRKSGDRFSPLGMAGSKKLKDFYIDEKIPRKQREKIPLVCCGSDVAWIIGYRVSDRFKIDDTTRRILILKYIPEISC